MVGRLHKMFRLSEPRSGADRDLHRLRSFSFYKDGATRPDIVGRQVDGPVCFLGHSGVVSSSAQIWR